MPCAWVAGDEVYGGDGPLRAWLETRRIATCSRWPRITGSPPGPAHHPRGSAGRRLPGKAWQRLSAGAGAKGHRWYDWAWVTIDAGQARDTGSC